MMHIVIDVKALVGKLTNMFEGCVLECCSDASQVTVGLDSAVGRH